MESKLYKLDHRHSECGKGATLDEILQAEKALGYQLPDEYKKFLVELNGVSFCHEHEGEYAIPCFFDYPLDSRPSSRLPTATELSREAYEGSRASLSSVGELYGIDDEFFLRAKRDLGYHAIFGWIPANVFPIGWDDTGDSICLVLDGKDTGSVYYWSRPDVPLSQRNEWSELAFLRWVASDFEAFWNNIALLTYKQYTSFTD